MLDESHSFHRSTEPRCERSECLHRWWLGSDTFAGGIIARVRVQSHILYTHSNHYPHRFIGVVVRKQLFVQIYAYTIFLHFFLNIAIGIFLIWLVTHFSTTAAYKVCLDTIQDPEAQKQCTGFLNTARSVWIVVTILVLLIEMCMFHWLTLVINLCHTIDGAIIAARYLNQIKSEKRDARTARQSAIKLIPRNTDPSSDDQQQALLLHPNTTDYSREFNPYEGDGGVARQESSASAFSTRGGYGGGSWTHSDIAEAEKARLRRVDLEMGIEEAPRDLEADAERQHQQDMKTPAGPPPRPPPTDSLPRYSLTDTPAGR